MAEVEKKKTFSLVMIVGLVVAGLILAGGVSYYIATKIAGDRPQQPVTYEPGVLVKLGDAKDGLIVNIGGVNSGRYLKIGLVLEIRPDKTAAAKEGTKGPSPDEIKTLDTAVHVLRSQKIEDFDPSKQDKLKELIKNEVNKALGGDRVLHVYITNFVLQ